MLDPGSNSELPPIPAKRYFTIGEVSELCGVKPHVLRYWEQEFPSLKPVKRRGNRRYYQRHDVLMIRQIRSLLYDQGFTIGGARQRLEGEATRAAAAAAAPPPIETKVPAELVRQMRIDLEAVLEILR
ncbi:MAG: MerR family transcriptional regulator [Rhodanobacteraceae bacterium]|nr:MerR family transcriptional regulator [Rhodanobacteraceae bacterium]